MNSKYIFSEEAKKVLQIAESNASDSMSDAIAPAHLLKAVLQKEIGLINIIEKDLHKDYYSILNWAESEILSLPKSESHKFNIPYSDSTKAIFETSARFQSQSDYNGEALKPIFILLALVTPDVGFFSDKLKILNKHLSANDILRYLKMDIITEANVDENPTDEKTIKYTINKYIEAKNGYNPIIIGFEKQLQSIFETLGKHNKSNVLILGESGVGKTALIDAFVQRIIYGEVPDFLKDSNVFELDLSEIVSEANYKNEIESRAKQTLKAINKIKNSVLVIEGIDKIFDKQSLLHGISTLLKKELNKSKIRLIATSSIEGFTKNIETDKEFISKIEKLTIDEPLNDMAERIIKGAKQRYYEHHNNLKVSDEVVKEAIILAKRYMSERSLPDSAFDLIDKSLSHIHTMNNFSEREIKLLKNELIEIKNDAKKKNEDEITFDLKWLHHKIFNRLSFLLTSQLDDDKDFVQLKNNEEKIKHLETILTKLQELSKNKRTALEKSDLSLVIAQQTGIPIGKMQANMKEKLENAESTLKERVVGQDHAVKSIVNYIRIYYSGLAEKNKPIASVFFMGPTGTGKTELTKALAEFLFLDESAIIRLDMSEYQEAHSVATLIGAPAGYVGYEEGGLLVNMIRSKEYSIVLLDEIEKAHSSIYNLLFQILDEACLHDKLNRKGNFSNAVIVFTSNAGSDYIFNTCKNGDIDSLSDDDLKQEMIKKGFPEPFLGRLTKIIPFAPITEDIVLMIFNIHLNKFLKTLENLDIKLTVSDEAKKMLAMSEFSPQLGARPILGIIRDKIRNPLSEMIVSGEVKAGANVTLEMVNSELKWNINQLRINN